MLLRHKVRTAMPTKPYLSFHLGSAPKVSFDRNGFVDRNGAPILGQLLQAGHRIKDDILGYLLPQNGRHLGDQIRLRSLTFHSLTLSISFNAMAAFMIFINIRSKYMYMDTTIILATPDNDHYQMIYPHPCSWSARFAPNDMWCL